MFQEFSTSPSPGSFSAPLPPLFAVALGYRDARRPQYPLADLIAAMEFADDCVWRMLRAGDMIDRLMLLRIERLADRIELRNPCPFSRSSIERSTISTP